MRLHHFGIAVKNLKKSIEVYKSLNYTCDSKIIKDFDRNINIVFMTNGMTRVELIEKADKNIESPVDNILDNRNRHNIYHSCYQVDCLEMEINRLQKQNFIMMVKPEPAIAFDSKRVCFMFNFDVGMIELLEI